MSISLLLLLLFLFTTPVPIISSPIHSPHFTKSTPLSYPQTPQQYLELTPPLSTDNLTPSYTSLLLSHSFNNTYGQPPVSLPYTPPPPHHRHFSTAILQFSASCKGEQYDRIAAIWLDGVELLRTSTAEPTPNGVFWTVKKDVTKYFPLLITPNLTLTVMLENIVNEVFTGVYHLNISLNFYKPPTTKTKLPNIMNINRKLFTQLPNSINNYIKPADMIIPISGTQDQGFWFRIQSESIFHSKEVEIPLNTYKAVLEIYVSFHGDDEFWYSNPPDSYIEANNLTTKRGNGVFREVLVTIDDKFVGSVVPFPVIFTGGINPLFWEPLVSIGAFNLPSYDVILTPFLGSLLDGKSHSFGIGVVNSIPFWLVDANLHIWLDQNSPEMIQAKVVEYRVPALKVERRYVIQQLDGKFKTQARRSSDFIGWVNSYGENLTSYISQEYKFKNLIKYRKNASEKTIEQSVSTKTEIKVETDNGTIISHMIVKKWYPLNINMKSLAGATDDTYLMITDVSQSIREKMSGNVTSSMYNKQDSSGWMVVKDHDVLSGAGKTSQVYESQDEFGCYSRIIDAANGRILDDTTSFTCSTSF